MAVSVPAPEAVAFLPLSKSGVSLTPRFADDPLRTFLWAEFPDLRAFYRVWRQRVHSWPTALLSDQIDPARYDWERAGRAVAYLVRYHLGRTALADTPAAAGATAIAHGTARIGSARGVTLAERQQLLGLWTATTTLWTSATLHRPPWHPEPLIRAAMLAAAFDQVTATGFVPRDLLDLTDVRDAFLLQSRRMRIDLAALFPTTDPRRALPDSPEAATFCEPAQWGPSPAPARVIQGRILWHLYAVPTLEALPAAWPHALALDVLRDTRDRWALRGTGIWLVRHQQAVAWPWPLFAEALGGDGRGTLRASRRRLHAAVPDRTVRDLWIPAPAHP